MFLTESSLKANEVSGIHWIDEAAEALIWSQLVNVKPVLSALGNQEEVISLNGVHKRSFAKTRLCKDDISTRLTRINWK